MRKIHAEAVGNRETRVYRDTDWDDYIVKYFVDGQHLTEADSHHWDDKQGALDTAKQWLWRGQSRWDQTTEQYFQARAK
jgi:hypothetical protein